MVLSGIVRQNSPIPSAVIELTKKANESINAVVLASEPKGAIQSTNEPTDDAEDEDYPESPQTTVGVADGNRCTFPWMPLGALIMPFRQPSTYHCSLNPQDSLQSQVQDHSRT